jgi:hypothetical protein
MELVLFIGVQDLVRKNVKGVTVSLWLHTGDFVMIKWIRPWKDTKFYVFDTSNPGNYGIGTSLEKAEKNLQKRQKIKSEILKDFNDFEIFTPETRDYIAGLISRNWEAIEKIRKETREK